tara:strand:- start:251 stop:868 length:618 start_codon:yes stop_codon:yes gene_type:complete
MQTIKAMQHTKLAIKRATAIAAVLANGQKSAQMICAAVYSTGCPIPQSTVHDLLAKCPEFFSVGSGLWALSDELSEEEKAEIIAEASRAKPPSENTCPIMQAAWRRQVKAIEDWKPSKSPFNKPLTYTFNIDYPDGSQDYATCEIRVHDNPDTGLKSVEVVRVMSAEINHGKQWLKATDQQLVFMKRIVAELPQDAINEQYLGSA